MAYDRTAKQNEQLIDNFVTDDNEFINNNERTDNITEKFGGSVIDELVGDGKKFKTIEDLVIGKLEADRFIEQLKKENRELRNKLENAMTLSELLEQNVNAPSNPGETRENPSLTDERAGENRNMVDTNANTTNENDLEQKILEVFEKLSRSEKRKQNLNMVVSKYQEAYGDKAVDVLERKLGELGLDTDAFNILLEKSPTAVSRLLELDNLKPKENPETVSPMGDVEKTSVYEQHSNNNNTLSLDEAIRNGAPKSFWDKVRRENKALYLSRRVQEAIVRSATKLGDAYWNN